MEEELRDLACGRTSSPDRQEQLLHELRRYRDELEDRTRELLEVRTRLEQALQEGERYRKLAEEGDRLKSEFLSRMSHELRTPLSGMLGMTELALMEGLPPRAEEYLRLAKQSARALLEVVIGMLDLSKLERGRAELAATPGPVKRTPPP